MTYSNPTRKWSDVANNVRRSFGDESGVQLEDGDMLRWINEGQHEICRQNRVLKRRATMLAVEMQSTYTLDFQREILQIESLRVNGVRLQPTDFTVVDANLGDYPADAQGDPSLWYKWGNEIVLWPAPKAEVPIEIYYTGAPEWADVWDLSRVLEIPDNYFLPLVDYVMSRAHEMDDNQQSQQMSIQLYADRMSTMNDEERGGQTLSFPTINVVD